MSFKFKIGDLVLSKADIVQQAIQKQTIAKVLLVTGLISLERKDGTSFYYEFANDDYPKSLEHELVGIDGYNLDFTVEQVLEFIKTR